jgi:hypothetical protein
LLAIVDHWKRHTDRKVVSAEYDESGNIDSCDLPFDIASLALSEVLPGLRHHDHMRDRLLVSFATARDNAFVLGSVTVPVPDMCVTLSLLSNVLTLSRSLAHSHSLPCSCFAHYSSLASCRWGSSAVPMGTPVTLAQFVRGLSAISPNATKQERMKVCFAAFDLNGDGFVDPPGECSYRRLV